MDNPPVLELKQFVIFSCLLLEMLSVISWSQQAETGRMCFSTWRKLLAQRRATPVKWSVQGDGWGKLLLLWT